MWSPKIFKIVFHYVANATTIQLNLFMRLGIESFTDGNCREFGCEVFVENNLRVRCTTRYTINSYRESNPRCLVQETSEVKTTYNYTFLNLIEVNANNRVQ